jgi:hypothetical protein
VSCMGDVDYQKALHRVVAGRPAEDVTTRRRNPKKRDEA